MSAQDGRAGTGSEVRILARAWLFVIWHCWHDGVAYDPARHRALQTLLNQDQPAAA